MNPQIRRMRDKLQQLVELQLLDNEIIEFEIEREKIPAQLNQMEGGLLEKRKLSDEKEHQLAHLEEELGEKTRLLDLERIKLKNTRNKETAIQNIKQYEAFIKEIETQEKSSGELDEEIAAIKKNIQLLRQEKGELDTKIKTSSDTQTKERRELEKRLAELDGTLEELYDKRDELAEQIDEQLYLKYEYIAERKDGIAVALVEHGHCSICNMAIPPQMHNELIRGDQFHACPACNRILVYREREKE
ncbi:MAG: hypothetical protein C4523_04200 [Myxococcales bacterium]|nr:MAG: hypothetical protein C4523_04200 [Myxococcales bacterium]